MERLALGSFMQWVVKATESSKEQPSVSYFF